MKTAAKPAVTSSATGTSASSSRLRALIALPLAAVGGRLAPPAPWSCRRRRAVLPPPGRHRRTGCRRCRPVPAVGSASRRGSSRLLEVVEQRDGVVVLRRSWSVSESRRSSAPRPPGPGSSRPRSRARSRAEGRRGGRGRGSRGRPRRCRGSRPGGRRSTAPKPIPAIIEQRQRATLAPVGAGGVSAVTAPGPPRDARLAPARPPLADAARR